MPTTFAIIKERKDPPDRRVVFSPEKCQEVIKKFPDARIIVEASDVRIFPDEAYREAGFEVVEDISAADVMLGVKEVPVDALIPNKMIETCSFTFLRSLVGKLITFSLEAK